jgi:hypothetical protein
MMNLWSPAQARNKEKKFIGLTCFPNNNCWAQMAETKPIAQARERPFFSPRATTGDGSTPPHGRSTLESPVSRNHFAVRRRGIHPAWAPPSGNASLMFFFIMVFVSAHWAAPLSPLWYPSPYLIFVYLVWIFSGPTWITYPAKFMLRFVRGGGGGGDHMVRNLMDFPHLSRLSVRLRCSQARWLNSGILFCQVRLLLQNFELIRNAEIFLVENWI